MRSAKYVFCTVSTITCDLVDNLLFYKMSPRPGNRFHPRPGNGSDCDQGKILILVFTHGAKCSSRGHAFRDPSFSIRAMAASCKFRYSKTLHSIPLTPSFSALSKGSSTKASSLQLFPCLPIKANPRPVTSTTYRDTGSVAGNLAITNTTRGLSDPLADPAGCRRDVSFLKDLQTNVVRTYFVDPYQDHSECMAVFSQAGIYVIADLMAPGYMIPAVDPVWNNVLYNRYISVIDTMHHYSNLLGFILGDDVISGIGQDSSRPYVKAAVRDMKAYIRDRNYRPIPVGYVSSLYYNSNDHVLPTAIPIASPGPVKSAVPIDMENFEVRNPTSVAPTEIPDYLNCGDERDNNIDFWGANIRSWCRSSNFNNSGYANVTSDFSSFPVPVFLAAYGCPTASSRDFSEIVTIYGHLMSSVWSGGIIYQYFSQAGSELGKQLNLDWRASSS